MGDLGDVREEPSSPAGTSRTKAETLQWLRSRAVSFGVPALLFFTVREWQQRPHVVLRRIRTDIRAAKLAVRSSAWAETLHPGRYTSYLDVPADPASLRTAIERVAASFDGDTRDQVLVQAMVSAVTMSGVVVTTDLDRGGPYLTIEYDTSGSTDRVTGGSGRPGRVLVHRRASVSHVTDPCLRRLLRVVAELEHWWPEGALEVEFAESADEIQILQVRRLSPRRRWSFSDARALDQVLHDVERAVIHTAAPCPGVAGTGTVLGTMPDWNPAELIGAAPRALAASLLAYLVTDRVWADARVFLGYRRVRGRLMRPLVGRPYIDVRLSLNSLLPAGLPDAMATPIVDASLARLRAHPELHDKIEFEVAVTAWDFDADNRLRRYYGGALSRHALTVFGKRLRALTRCLVTDSSRGSLAQAIARIERAAWRYTRDVPGGPVRRCADADPAEALRVFADCRRYDALPFAMIARHAFVAEAMLRSAVRRGAITAERLTAFKRSLPTITRTFTRRMARVRGDAGAAAALLRVYGHLRPGSFDITSPRYDRWMDPVRVGTVVAAEEVADDPRFMLSPHERRAIDHLVVEAGLLGDAGELFRYAAAAIVGRERAKFLLTKRLSDALETLATWGAEVGLTRAALANVTHSEVAACLSVDAAERAAALNDRAQQRIARRDGLAGVRMSHLIRGPADVWVVRSDASRPTFVTTRAVVGVVACPVPIAVEGRSLTDSIVCIESADPGYDWIFTESIAGLVTCFGGANSHMGIRCTELGIPAALGVGDVLFERVARAQRAELRCGEHTLRPLCAGA